MIYILCVVADTASAQTCDGRYIDSDTLIEQAYGRYGTLYSGGPDTESVGPTLEIYRLLSGLPDSGMAERRPWEAEFIDPGGDFDPVFVGETFMRSLPRLHDPSYRRDTPEGSTDVEVLLNRLTTIGPFAGWWLAPDAPHLSDVEQVIAQYAVDDGLDWLLSVQAASARPHQTAWHLQRHTTPRDMDTVLAHALERYLSTKSLTWLVAAQTLREGHSRAPRTEALAALDTHTARLRRAVAECSASPADYVAASISGFEELRRTSTGHVELDRAQTLPPVLRQMAAVQLGKSMMTRWRFYGDPISHDDLAVLANDATFAPWHNIGRSYLADDIDTLIAVHDGTALDPKTYRLLNLLSAADLLRFAESRPEESAERRDLTSVAYLRLFALNRDDEAAELVGRLQTLWPERADLISKNWQGNASLGVRLARVALSLPEPRTLVVPPRNGWDDAGAFEETTQADCGVRYWAWARRSRDIPISIRNGGFLARDLGFWMGAIGSDPYAGYSVDRRTYRRGIIDRDVLEGVLPLIPQTSGYYGSSSIANWAAWDELSQLGPQTGLANRIGREIILNVRVQTQTWPRQLLADKDLLSEELALVIQQGRRMIHGDMDGAPLGRVAFELLHRRFGRTEAAARTPYWFICQERCEP